MSGNFLVPCTQEGKLYLDTSLRSLLAFDPIAEAERLSGGPNPALSVALKREHAVFEAQALSMNADVYRDMHPSLYLRVLIEDLGFEKVLEEPFQELEGKTDHLWVLAHRELGLLVRVDSIGGTQIHSGELFFNWETKDLTRPFIAMPEGIRISCRGEFRGDLFTCQGCLDATRAVKFALGYLRRNHGYLLPLWKLRPFIFWVMNHEEIRQATLNKENARENFGDALSERRLIQLPKWAQAIYEKAV